MQGNSQPVGSSSWANPPCSGTPRHRPSNLSVNKSTPLPLELSRPSPAERTPRQPLTLLCVLTSCLPWNPFCVPQCGWRWRRPIRGPSTTRASAAPRRLGSSWRTASTRSLCASARRVPRASSQETPWTPARHTDLR